MPVHLSKIKKSLCSKRIDDLNNYLLKEGSPEDFVSLSTNIDYIKLNKKSKEYSELQDFLKQILPKFEIREYVLNTLASLPVATLTMVLQSTPANADEANMQLEDFAKLHEGNTNVDKALPSEPKDI